MPICGTLGVTIVTFNSADVILGCLASLFASRDAALRVVVTDNSSDDDTVSLVRDWARKRAASDWTFSFAELSPDTGEMPTASMILLRSPYNGGYAHGVNAGLRVLLRDAALDLFWVLNPDCEVTPDAAARYCAHGADGQFSLMCGRTIYKERPHEIQTDGGRVNLWTGVCSATNLGRPANATPLPNANELDFIPGSNAVATRAFVERAGLMPEEYFLYYEEVDWAFRRGALPLRIVDDVIVYHYGGTAIGSGSRTRAASSLSNYFNYRNRIRFLKRYRPVAVPVGLTYATAKAAQLLMRGRAEEAAALAAGAFGFAPPAAVRDRIAPGKARQLAFGER